MSTLLVDNYDSYTYNIFHLLAEVTGEEPIVIRNDAVSWRALSRWEFDAIVLSPGPGRPQRWHDFGVCSDILRSSATPVLGVCLGHQGIGRLLEAEVATAPVAMHGRLSRVKHTGAGLFAGIPQDFSAVRYHSLAVTGPLGAQGRVIAWTDDGVVMGIEHARRPLWGVQFHPESIATEHGRELFENFYALAHRHSSPRPRSRGPRPSAAARPARAARGGRLRPRAPDAARVGGTRGMSLRVRTIAGEPATEPLFERLFGACEYAFWLDSADAPTSLAQSSYLGTTSGPNRMVLEGDVEQGIVRIHRAAASTVERASIFEVLGRELAERALAAPAEVAQGLLGGFVGYLGYECKADCGAANGHRSDMPDALLMLANRVVVVDHARRHTLLLALCDREDEASAERWLADAETVVCEVLGGGTISDPTSRVPSETSVSFSCGRGRAQYLADIARCQAALAAGESYEICLTDQIHTDASPDPFATYRLLRRHNPAPFAAYLKLGESTVLSSSPERFLSVDRDRRVQARPIKGTAARSDDPLLDAAARAGLVREEKTFAEHLMIVDLLRNDLGRVCVPGSVRVPELMVPESYATVHQLISNVTGVLGASRTPVDCVRACFPGGSMTGAPKLRTMEIIDDVEREARGVYSGALGYFGLDGSVDLSIVIRTVVLRPGAATIGAGGAIVMQSDPEEEFEEMLLKARAPMAAIAQALAAGDAQQAWTIELEPGPAESALA